MARLLPVPLAEVVWIEKDRGLQVPISDRQLQSNADRGDFLWLLKMSNFLPKQWTFSISLSILGSKVFLKEKIFWRVTI